MDRSVFVARVFAAAREQVLQHDDFPSFRHAVIGDAIRIGKGSVRHAMRLEVGKFVAREVWEESPDEFELLDPLQRDYLEALRDGHR